MVESVYFTSLEIENVRCFGDRQELSLTVDGRRPAQWTLILGDNGVGKTTLLECLAWMRLVKKGYDPALFDEENDFLIRLRPRIRRGNIGLSSHLLIGANLSSTRDNTNKSGSRGKSARMSLSIDFDPDDPDGDILSKYKYRWGSDVNSLIVTYGADRHRGFRNLTNPDLEDPIGTRLSGRTVLYDVEEMLSNLHHASETNEEPERDVQDLERLKNVLTRILPEDVDPDEIRIFAPDSLGRGRPSGVIFNTFTGEVSLSELSLGYQTTLAWTADFAWRLMRRYPNSEDPFSEPAVVLIDEIDLHLHPRWQQTIMEDLSKIFPATQFIATSHSPLMAQVAEKSNFALLNKRQEENDVEIVNEPESIKGWRVDQILTSELFGGIGARSATTEQLFVDRDALLSKPTLSEKDEAELHRLRLEIERLPVDQFAGDRDSITMIRETAALLRRHQRGGE